MANEDTYKLEAIKDTHNRAVRISREAITWLIEQAEKVEMLEKQLESALFTFHEEPVPKRTFPIEMKVSFGGKLPIAPDRDY